MRAGHEEDLRVGAADDGKGETDASDMSGADASDITSFASVERTAPAGPVAGTL